MDIPTASSLKLRVSPNNTHNFAAKMFEQQPGVDWRFVAPENPFVEALGGNEIQWDEVMRRHPLKPHPHDGISTFIRIEIDSRAFPSPYEDTATIFKPGREPSPELNYADTLISNL